VELATAFRAYDSAIDLWYIHCDPDDGGGCEGLEEAKLRARKAYDAARRELARHAREHGRGVFQQT
jgi:hypothetical protein